MIFNGIEKIKDYDGDYIVLVDYGQDGIAIWGQFETPDEAIQRSLAGTSNPCAVVKLVRLAIEEEPEKKRP